ncbi:hypothetical protein [Streptomyces hygroscopicus]|uniref:hypothetical protein n=1 Tax=Streptomyces hygroscopicus TaxID=1912 RepID=UPI000B0B1EFC|nr:hypothetical protein [Streptomyces hygroscopicus]
MVCEASNGRDYSVLIPGCINPAIAVLLPLALVCALTSAFLRHKQRTRTREKV